MTEKWQERQQSFWMKWRVCVFEISQHVQMIKDYHPHYFFYYAHYFACLTMIEQHVASAYTLQANIQLLFEIYLAMELRSPCCHKCPIFNN
jgi:hypothetical protein